MHEIIWVRRVFAKWPTAIPDDRRELPFYRIARTFDAKALLPQRTVLKDVVALNEADRAGIEAWKAWSLYIDGDVQRGLKQLRALAGRAREQGEPHLLYGAASLLERDRATAIKALNKAIAIDAELVLAQSLLDQFDPRKRPVLPFLDRGNPVNKLLGKLRHRLVDRRAAAAG